MTVGAIEHVLVLADDTERTNSVPGGPRQVFVEDPNGVRLEINVIEINVRRRD